MPDLDLTAIRARLDAVIYGRTAQSGVSPSEYLAAEAALIDHASDDIGVLLDHVDHLTTTLAETRGLLSEAKTARDQLQAENQRLRQPAEFDISTNHGGYAYVSGPIQRPHYAQVAIDEVGNFGALTKGDPRALAAILRMIANEIEEDARDLAQLPMGGGAA